MIGCVCSSFLKHSLHAVLPTTQWVPIAGDLNIPPTIYKFLGNEIYFYIHIWTHIWQMIRIDFHKDAFSKIEQLNQIPHHCQSKHFCQENEWSVPWGKSAQILEVWLFLCILRWENCLYSVKFPSSVLNFRILTLLSFSKMYQLAGHSVSCL
jgi:hypothetical protein